jgi:Tir chaperone protein (CesT) family
MSNRETVAGWLRVLPGVEEPLQIDDRGQCVITVDDAVCVVFVPETLPVFHLYSDLMPLPLDVRSTQLEAILIFNLFTERTGDAVLALDPEPRSLVLTYKRGLDDTDATIFGNTLFNFAEAAKRVKQDLIEILAPSEEQAQSNEAAPEQRPEFSRPGDLHIINP